MKRSATVAATLALVALGVAAPPEWAQDLTSRVGGSFLGLMAWQWILILALLVLGLINFWIIRFIAKRLIRFREKRTGKSAETGEQSIRRGAGILGLLLPWYMFLPAVELTAVETTDIHLAVESLTILAVVLLAYGVWDAVCDAISQRATSVAHAEKLLIPVTRKLVRFAILLVGVFVALGIFGVNITGLLAGAGLGALVVALAAKNSVENVFGSLTILFDMPFAIGDWVKIDKYEGIIEEINLRSTRIRTFDDSVITLPNSNLITAAVENFGARRYRRQRFFVRVSYANEAATLDHFIKLVRDYLATVPEVVRDRSVVELNDMTEASVGVLVQCFFEASSFSEEVDLRSKLMLAIFKAQAESGVIFIGTPIPPRPSK